MCSSDLTYRGGTSDPFIVHWPRGMQGRGEVRSQYGHAIDMVPTVLDAIGLEAPDVISGVTQSPLEGIGLYQTFNDAMAPDRHHTQYFEMFGHRSIYHDGWRAVCPWPGPSFAEAGKPFGSPLSAETLTQLDAHGWELYHIATDFAENYNVAAQNRPKLIEMIATWYVEAGKYKVLPIDSRSTHRFAEERPQIAADRVHYTYFPRTQNIPMNAAVNVLNRSYSMTADVEIPSGGAEGVLLCQGGIEGGYAFYVKENRLSFVMNYANDSYTYVKSEEPLPPGRHLLRYEFEVTGEPDIAHGKGSPGRGQLFIDGNPAGSGDIPVTLPIAMGLSGGLSIGKNAGSPVSREYEPPFSFTGNIHSVTVDISGELTEEIEVVKKESEMRMVMARQ